MANGLHIIKLPVTAGKVWMIHVSGRTCGIKPSRMWQAIITAGCNLSCRWLFWLLLADLLHKWTNY